MVIRLSLSSIGGVFVTLALFYLMQALIQGADSALSSDKTLTLVDFVRVKQNQQLETKDRKPKKPPPPDEPPPDVPPQNFNVAVDKASVSMAGLDARLVIDVGGAGFGIGEGDDMAIVKVQPQYPRRALSRGMSGWVIVEFTVSEKGTVIDVIVLENCGWVQNARKEGECVDNPNSVFDSAAVKAASKFKYKPKVIDGDPVATAGVLNKITFELIND